MEYHRELRKAPKFSFSATVYNKRTLKQWIQVIRKKNLPINSSSRVCSRHFKNSERRKLRCDELTLFPSFSTPSEPGMCSLGSRKLKQIKAKNVTELKESLVMGKRDCDKVFHLASHGQNSSKLPPNIWRSRNSSQSSPQDNRQNQHTCVSGNNRHPTRGQASSKTPCNEYFVS